MPKVKFIPISNAIEISGHPTNRAFDRWCRRFNADHPAQPVIRRHNAVEVGSLERALMIDARRMTPELDAGAALSALHTGEG